MTLVVLSCVVTLYSVRHLYFHWVGGHWDSLHRILSVIRYFSLLFLCNFRSLFYLLSKEKYVNKYSITWFLDLKDLKWLSKEKNRRMNVSWYLSFSSMITSYLQLLWTCDYVICLGLLAAIFRTILVFLISVSGVYVVCTGLCSE